MADILVKVRVGYHYIVNESLFHSSEDEPFNVSEKNYNLQRWKLEKVDPSGTPLSVIEAQGAKKATETKVEEEKPEQDVMSDADEAKLEAEAGEDDKDLSEEDEKEVAEQEEEVPKSAEKPKKERKRAKRK